MNCGKYTVRRKEARSRFFRGKRYQRLKSLSQNQIEDCMKKQIMKVVATLSLLVPMSIGAFAALDGRVNVNIPFDFNVGDKEFKAGKYYVDRFTSTNTLIIRS